MKIPAMEGTMTPLRKPMETKIARITSRKTQCDAVSCTCSSCSMLHLVVSSGLGDGAAGVAGRFIEGLYLSVAALPRLGVALHVSKAVLTSFVHAVWFRCSVL